MELVKHSPSSGIYAATPDYIHAMEVRNPARFLFVSGTMGLDAQGVLRAAIYQPNSISSGQTCGRSLQMPTWTLAISCG